MTDQFEKESPRIRVIVIEPGGPRNLGSIARAMANFGYTDLFLVGQKDSDEDGQGARVSMRGEDVYNARRVAGNLEEALEGCDLVIGATRRARTDESCIDFREAAVIAALRARETTVALVLGRERDGLSREERARCHLLTEVPSVEGPAGSLNISHAAAVILCGIYCAGLEPDPRQSADPGPLVAAFHELYKKSGSCDDTGKAQLIFRGLVERGGLTPEEALLLEKSFRFFGSKMKAGGGA
jgi:TrmH family RNA methyltransferase